jgi:hypothetical protein
MPGRRRARVTVVGLSILLIVVCGWAALGGGLAGN